MIEVTVRCGCTRAMSPEWSAGPGRYRCGCGARVTLTGLPKLDATHCPMPRGKRVCLPKQQLRANFSHDRASPDDDHDSAQLARAGLSSSPEQPC